VALIGYIPEMRPFAMAMLILIVLSIVLTHSGAVAQLESKI